MGAALGNPIANNDAIFFKRSRLIRQINIQPEPRLDIGNVCKGLNWFGPSWMCRIRGRGTNLLISSITPKLREAPTSRLATGPTFPGEHQPGRQFQLLVQLHADHVRRQKSATFHDSEQTIRSLLLRNVTVTLQRAASGTIVVTGQRRFSGITATCGRHNPQRRQSR